MGVRRLALRKARKSLDSYILEILVIVLQVTKIASLLHSVDSHDPVFGGIGFLEVFEVKVWILG